MHQGLPDDLDQEGDLGPVVCSEGHCQREGDNVLQNLELVVIRVDSSRVHQLKVGASCSHIVVVNSEDVASEDVQTLVEELAVEDESREPEPAVFLEDLLVDGRGDLDLTVHCEGETAGVEEVVRCALIRVLAFVLGHHAVVIGKFVELFLVDETKTLIDQNIGVFGLVASLVVDDLLHGGIVLVLFYLGLPVLVLSAESLIRDLAWIKVCHMSIIELVPLCILFLAFFSILDEGVVVARIRGAVMHDDALELVLEVLVRHDAV